MTGFFGTDRQIETQKRLCRDHAGIAANPALSNGGRILNILDPDALGWDTARALVERDGYAGFTAMPPDPTLQKLRDLFGKDVQAPYWLALFGTPPDVLPACDGVIGACDLPPDWRRTATGIWTTRH